MNLFLTCVAVITVLVFLIGGLFYLINYTISKTGKSREKMIADRHDAMIQQTHFKELDNYKH